MRSRAEASFLPLLGIFCLVVTTPRIAAAQENPVDKAVRLFRSLTNSVNRNVDSLKRRQAVRLSGNFADSLSRLEQDKRLLIRQIRDDSYEADDINRTVLNIRESTSKAIRDLEALKPKLVEVGVMPEVITAGINEAALERQLRLDLEGKENNLRDLQLRVLSGTVSAASINRNRVIQRIGQSADKVGTLYRAVESFRARLRRLN